MADELMRFAVHNYMVELLHQVQRDRADAQSLNKRIYPSRYRRELKKLSEQYGIDFSKLN